MQRYDTRILTAREMIENKPHLVMSMNALLTDLHVGVSDDDINHIAYHKMFYEHIFFPNIIENDTDTVFILGDVFDRRRYVNNKTLYDSMKMLFDRLEEMDIVAYVLVGNHDMYYPHQTEPNSVKLFLSQYENVAIMDKPKTLVIGGQEVCFIPWICNENEKECMHELKTSPADICFVHAGIQGFAKYHVNISKDDGFPTKLFSNFKYVFSGHYHHRCSKTIKGTTFFYLGTAFQTAYNDVGSVKGFHNLYYPDGDNELKLEFIENPNELFYILKYMDDSSVNYRNNIFRQARGKMTRILVYKQPDNMEHYKKFRDAVARNNPITVDLKPVKLTDSAQRNGVVFGTAGMEDLENLDSRYYVNKNLEEKIEKGNMSHQKAKQVLKRYNEYMKKFDKKRQAA